MTPATSVGEKFRMKFLLLSISRWVKCVRLVEAPEAAIAAAILNFSFAVPSVVELCCCDDWDSCKFVIDTRGIWNNYGMLLGTVDSDGFGDLR